MLLTYFNVLDQLELEVEFTHNPFGFKATDLFEVGARVNPKRSFLFVSRLIGKHLDVHADVPKATGHLLASLFLEETKGVSSRNSLPLVDFVKTGTFTEEVGNLLNTRHELSEKTLFIGFAETATGLGHAVFSAFNGASFVHTTREELVLDSVFDFEEEHSHAVDHRCYLKEKALIEEAEHIVLIDDEMTTGKTSLNLIRSLHKFYPKKQFTILCLLDWRNDEQKQSYKDMENELNIKISVVSLTQGSMKLSKEAFFEYEQVDNPIHLVENRMICSQIMPNVQARKENSVEYVKYPFYSGRFGLTSNEHDKVEESAKSLGSYLKPLRKGKKTLVLGTGEFMYLPSRIASYMGEGVTTKSTTRSPIYPCKVEGYPIHDRIHFVDDDGVSFYAYNLKEAKYDEVFIVFEKNISRETREEIASRFADNNITHVTFVCV